MRTLKKDIKRSITDSFGRFISIMLLMLLGSFALTGLFVTGPNMRKTGINYFKKYNTADISVTSDYGIDDTEIENLNKVSNIKDIEYIYLKDVTIKNTNVSFRIFSKPEKISLYELKEGKYPQKNNEIAIDYDYKNKYKIGDTIIFEAKDSNTLKKRKYKVVGYVYSSEILASLNKGETTVGTGALDSYAIINEDNFDSDVYMMAKITFKDTYNLDPYSSEYKEKIKTHKKEINKILKKSSASRLTVIKSEYQKQIDNAKEKLNNAKKRLEDTYTKLNEASITINAAKNEINKSENKLIKAKSQIENAEKQINENETILNNKTNEYNRNKNLLATKQKEYDNSLSSLKNQEIKLQNYKNDYNLKQSKLNKELILKTKEEYETNIKEMEDIIENKTYDDITSCEEKLQTLKTEYNNFLTNTYNPYLESEKQLETFLTQITDFENKINESKLKLETAQKELTLGYNSLNNAKNSLDNAYKTLNDAKTKLNSSKQEYNSSLNKLSNAKKELNIKENEYNEKLKEFKESDAESKITDGEEEINKSQSKVNALTDPTYTIYTRRELPGCEGYKIYATIAQIVDSLAKIFPVFLYLVAALVTLTTMTRFVNEQRGILGTLKSLGYADKDIIKKFTIYGFTSGTIGTIIGVILGHTLLPYIVYNAYKTGFTLPKLEIHFYPSYTILAIILSLCSSVLPAYIVAKRDLKEKPALLLLPKSPKAGTKILLEKIKFIWHKMSFTHKVTARNIFRYKSRMFMTIFGVAGATAILFTGFSVRASISKINQRQFKEIIKYDMIAVKNTDLSKEEENEFNENLQKVKSYLPIYYESATITSKKTGDDEELKVIVPSNEDEFSKYINLVNRKAKKHLSLNEVVISERLAEMLNVKVGDSFKYDSKDKTITVKVSGICEMYTGHFIFMNKETYSSVYNTEYKANSDLILLKNSNKTEKIASKFMKLSAVKGIVSNTTLENQIDTIVKSLNKIMKVLTVIAALLSVVIIYNLTNINVSERIRELSTIKVLGFKDEEVTMYIYRETILLTILGILVGFIIGLILHAYILEVVPPDNVMFNPEQWMGSFAIPCAVISLVSIIMGIYVHNKLKYIDMLEALKSVD